MSAADIEATIRYLVPGFLTLKVFYLVGLRTRRTEFEWTPGIDRQRHLLREA